MRSADDDCLPFSPGARNHAAEIIDMALDMLDSIVTVSNPTNNEKLKIRIGVFSTGVQERDS